MFAVIFEVQPRPERFNEYLELAKYLKPRLEAIDGFIDNERFESKRTKGKLLSLSTWRDEKSVIRWRTQGEHHGVQKKGRFEIFADYHLRVGEITADTEPPKGMRSEQMRFDETEIGQAKVATITEIAPHDGGFGDVNAGEIAARLGLNAAGAGLLGSELFESIYTPGKLLLLANWRDAEAARAWTPKTLDGAKAMRHRHVRIIRDYGMFDRREAPQFYPAVERSADQARLTQAAAS
jgi:heme-degrading monooxygenase HmoA